MLPLQNCYKTLPLFFEMYLMFSRPNFYFTFFLNYKIYFYENNFDIPQLIEINEPFFAKLCYIFILVQHMQCRDSNLQMKECND